MSAISAIRTMRSLALSLRGGRYFRKDKRLLEVLLDGGETLVRGLDLVGIDLEADIGASELQRGHARGAGAGEGIEDDDVRAGAPVGLDTAARQFFGEARIMGGA